MTPTWLEKLARETWLQLEKCFDPKDEEAVILAALQRVAPKPASDLEKLARETAKIIAQSQNREVCDFDIVNILISLQRAVAEKDKDLLAARQAVLTEGRERDKLGAQLAKAKELLRQWLGIRTLTATAPLAEETMAAAEWSKRALDAAAQLADKDKELDDNEAVIIGYADTIKKLGAQLAAAKELLKDMGSLPQDLAERRRAFLADKQK